MGDLHRSRYRLEKTLVGRGSGAGQFRDAVRGIALDAGDQLYVVGDSVLKVFAPDGTVARQWRTGRPPRCVAVSKDNRIFVGQEGQVQVYDAEGKLLDTWRDQHIGMTTEIGFAGDDVLLADTSERCIRRFDAKGRFLNNIGKDNRMRGFLIPNKHVDFFVDEENIIHVTNPGKHRVERYTVDDKLLGHFGRFGGTDPQGFSGCCNPTNVARGLNKQIVVTEKAGPRAKVYGMDGKLYALMGEAEFDSNCKNMDVAVDSKGRIYVVDTVSLDVRVYAPLSAATTSQPAPSAAGKAVTP